MLYPTLHRANEATRRSISVREKVAIFYSTLSSSSTMATSLRSFTVEGFRDQGSVQLTCVYGCLTAQRGLTGSWLPVYPSCFFRREAKVDTRGETWDLSTGLAPALPDSNGRTLGLSDGNRSTALASLPLSSHFIWGG